VRLCAGLASRPRAATTRRHQCAPTLAAAAAAAAAIHPDVEANRTAHQTAPAIVAEPIGETSLPLPAGVPVRRRRARPQ
jgi:hypothetical protein